MAYRWKPSASQRRAFAEKMKDPAEQAAYNDRKAGKAANRRAGSRYDYNIAGGNYIPTREQYNFAMAAIIEMTLSPEQENACSMVISAFNCNEPTHHDNIHIVNEMRRAEG